MKAMPIYLAKRNPKEYLKKLPYNMIRKLRRISTKIRLLEKEVVTNTTDRDRRNRLQTNKQLAQLEGEAVQFVLGSNGPVIHENDFIDAIEWVWKQVRKSG